MYRIAIETLLKWKQSKRRKPLIIEGARQVGKTWLMKEFGRQAYADAVYINFDSNSRMAELFEKYTDCVREHQTITDCLIFQNGFKLGARMMLEVMEE